MSPSDPDRPRTAKGRAAAAQRSRHGREVIDAPAANAARADKLRTNSLRRLARSHRLELRHSDYGFSLVDETGKRVDGRNDLTLNEVEKLLKAIGAPQSIARTRK
jgi:hypothetical protein